ncbi:MAG: hypothetical protein WCP09_01420 [Candidatus Taylorbacteria bacterium]
MKINIINNEDVVALDKHYLLPGYLKNGYRRRVDNIDVILEAENACSYVKLLLATAIGSFFIATFGASLYMWTAQNYLLLAIIVGAYVVFGITYYYHVIAQRPTPFTRSLNHLCQQLLSNLYLTLDQIVKMKSEDLMDMIRNRLDYLASVVKYTETKHGRDSAQQIEAKKVFDNLYKYCVRFDLAPQDKKVYFNKAGIPISPRDKGELIGEDGLVDTTSLAARSRLKPGGLATAAPSNE